MKFNFFDKWCITRACKMKWTKLVRCNTLGKQE
uniref:Uncharacterized protein n=1 Tax=Arundo donax TaxID=35708 RepID=A0A0A8XSI8_ARUDO